MRCLMWFREDLRVNDNTALYHASKAAGQGLLAVYVMTPKAWQAHHTAACRVDFILRNLQLLSEQLQQLNVPLVIIKSETFKDTPAALLQLIQQHNIDALYFNEQYEINEARRDMAVEQLLKQHNIKIFSYTDQVVLAPGEVLTQSGNYFTVFTPFKKAWLKLVSAGNIQVLPAPARQHKLDIKSDAVPAALAGFKSTLKPELWPAGEVHARKRLAAFVQQKIKLYAKQRDFPAIDGTSTLSPYLAAGILSPRQCLKAAIDANKQKMDIGEEGITTWINELIWREFYKHILNGFPRVSMGKAFKISTETIPWDNDTKLFAAWCEGRTGYPLIDAAMRQLQQIGWMHNRLRMITAMFLVKDLLIDWRWGERFFMEHLMDGDLAANNGGWQWAASTGTDAVPYFRVFNPVTQSQKFDPDGEFIRRYCPELAECDNKSIHAPYVLTKQRSLLFDYPKPIVDHDAARKRVLQIFKGLA